jgi:hypothetical protein
MWFPMDVTSPSRELGLPQRRMPSRAPGVLRQVDRFSPNFRIVRHTDGADSSHILAGIQRGYLCEGDFATAIAAMGGPFSWRRNMAGSGLRGCMPRANLVTRRSPRRRQTSYESRQARIEQARVLLAWSRQPASCSANGLECVFRQIVVRSLFFKASYVWDHRRPRPRVK